MVWPENTDSWRLPFPISMNRVSLPLHREASLRKRPSMTSEVVVLDYDANWPLQFAELHAFLWPAVANVAISIEHVGSTSVPWVLSSSTASGSSAGHRP